MALEYKAARTPGPIGLMPGMMGGRVPGPLAFQHVDLAKGTATKAAGTKTFVMPAPTSGSQSAIRARAVNWDLANKSPIPEDVLQGELANCPVAAILAALANTSAGKRRINDMVTEYTNASVKTTLTADILSTLAHTTKDDPDYKPQVKEIASTRYFSVALDSTFEVSDVFYVHYSDGAGVDMMYMGSPNSALWPCVIEKAYAVKVGSYDLLDDDTKHPVNEFWPALVGKAPQFLAIDDHTDLDQISRIAKAAKQTPAIAASKDGITLVLEHHGFAILGMAGSLIELYDPHGTKKKLSLTDFRSNFKAIFSGNP